MPEFVWNQYDLIECLAVLPEEEEYGIGCHFTVWRDGIRLLLSIYQYDAEIWLSLYRGESKESLFTIRMIDCSGMRFVKNPKGNDYLEFAVAKVFGGRYDGESPIPMGLRLTVDPDFKIELFP
jgi:hypothetical protein